MPHLEGVDDDGAGYGVRGRSDDGSGVVGLSTNSYGVDGGSTNTAGVIGRSDNGPGVYGVTSSGEAAGIHGHNETGAAGRFEGHVEVTKDLSVGGNVTVTGDVVLPSADCAEDFDVSEGEEIEPGTVMVITEDGALKRSQSAYDKRVAGVVSGAGDLKPGIILDRQESHESRVPVALIGKVACRVDAQYGPVEVGDLLTTSPTPGHAMKAHDPLKAFGAVIGKALRPLKSERGLIPVLIALQ